MAVWPARRSGGGHTGTGLHAAVRYDEGGCGPERRLVAADGRTTADVTGSLAQGRDGLIRLRSGSLLLVRHMGMAVDLEAVGRSQRRELMALVSKDDGRTWSEGLMIDERDVSYPDAQQADDGTIHLIWDHSRSKKQEIWMTTFREDDVLAADDAAEARVKAARRLVSKGGTPE